MSKNWSRIVLVSMLVLVVGASLASATTSRVRSLAGTGDYLSDDSNAYRWYSVLPSFANQVNAELGMYQPSYFFNVPEGSPLSYATRALAWNNNLHDGEWGTLRISLNEHSVDSPGLWSTNPFMAMHTPGMAGMNTWDGTTDYPFTPVNQIDLGWAKEFGENYSGGISMTRSSHSVKFTPADPLADETFDANYSFTTIGLGGSWSNNEDIVVDAVFNLGMAGGTHEWTDAGANPDVVTIEFDDNKAMEIAARGMWDQSDNTTVVGKFDWSTSNYSMKGDLVPATTPPYEYASIPTGDKNTAINLGLGCNMDVNGSNTLIFAVEWNKYHWEYSKPDTSTTSGATAELDVTMLPTIRLALETEITSWCTTRIGAVKNVLTKTKDTDQNGDETEYSESAYTGGFWDDNGFFTNQFFEWYLGVGFTVAEWTIDMELSPQTPFSMGWWLHGFSAFNPLYNPEVPITRISAVYNY